MKGLLPRVFTRWRPETGIALLLFAATLVLFGPVREFGYIHLDDYPYAAENPMVVGGMRWEGVQEALTTVHEQWWLPMLWISYMGDVAWFGTGPGGHHLVNLLLHAVNAALLFWVLFRLTGSMGRSVFVAALFAWHPTRVEAVAWIAARKDVLSGLFFMLALLAYVRHAERPSARAMGWVSGWMLLGLMSKAILIVLPPILLLLDVWPLRRAKVGWGRGAWEEWRPLLGEKILPIALAGVFTGINLWTHTTTRVAGAEVSVVTRLGEMAPNVMAYLTMIAVPVRLNIIYPESDAVSWPYSLAALVGLAVVTVAVLGQRERRPYLAMGWFWFLVALLPVLRGVRLGLAQYADRWTYLPLIGLGMAGAWGVAEWAGAGRRRGWTAAVAVLVLAACWFRTQVQLSWWRDSVVLFQRAAHLAPQSATVLNSLGLSLMKKGRAEEGAVWFERAVERQPENAGYHSNLGMARQLAGDAVAALAAHEEAIRLEPGRADFHNNRGNALLALGRVAEAEAAYREALGRNPGHVEAHFNLGGILYRAGRVGEARPHFETVVQARPGNATGWVSLGRVLEKLGRHAQAESCMERARRLGSGIGGGGGEAGSVP